jgi:hypothetical protein
MLKSSTNVDLISVPCCRPCARRESGDYILHISKVMGYALIRLYIGPEIAYKEVAREGNAKKEEKLWQRRQRNSGRPRKYSRRRA